MFYYCCLFLSLILCNYCDSQFLDIKTLTVSILSTATKYVHNNCKKTRGTLFQKTCDDTTDVENFPIFY